MVYFAFAASGRLVDFYKNDFNNIKESLMAYSFFWIIGFPFMFFSFLVVKISHEYLRLDTERGQINFVIPCLNQAKEEMDKLH